ncbi:MAG: hypothetical protein WCC21_06500 [Candidatus Acidiferrales bacterium]
MEKLGLFNREDLRYARAEIESARADTNREFIDKLGEIVEKDSTLAYEFCWQHDHKIKDPFDLYLEIKEREEVRRKKGLPPRVVLLPDWDKDDEERAKKRAANRRRKVAREPKSRSAKATRQVQTVVAPAPEGKW